MSAGVQLEMTAEAAFTSNEKGRIVAWNAGAERLLGHKRDQVLGRLCREIVCGVDSFGNPHCRKLCVPRQMLREKEAIHDFEIDVCRLSGTCIRATLSILIVQGPRASQHQLVHLLKAVPETVAAEPRATPRTGDRQAGAADSAPQAASQEGPLVTPRELEVLLLLAEGAGNLAIAESLFIAEATVRCHVQNILHKTGAHNKLQAVAIARRNQLI
jgi:PAS domain S-box-containing protein